MNICKNCRAILAGRKKHTAKRTAMMLKMLRANPDITYRELGESFGVSRQRVHQILKREGKIKPKPVIIDDEDIQLRGDDIA